MILYAFGPDELPQALRWSAAGGLALHVLPDAGTRLAPWEAGDRFGPARANLYGCDPSALLAVCKAVWINRAMLRDPGTPSQHVPVAGMPLPRLLRRSWGAAGAAPWFDADHAIGKLWADLGRKRPVRTALGEVLMPSRGWVGSTAGWWRTRPGWAWYARLPAGDAKWEHGVIGPMLTLMVSLAAERDAGEPVVRQYLTAAGGRALTAVAARVQPTLFRLLGQAVRRSDAGPHREFPWVARCPVPADDWKGYHEHLGRWRVTPGPDDFRRAGYV